MAILLDSASLDDAAAAAKLGFVRGITTNPALMARETREPLAHLARLLEAFPEGPICYQPTRSGYEEMDEQARAASALAPDRVVAKLPATLEAITLATALLKDGIPSALTAVYSPAQALLAHEAGCTWIIPYVDRAARHSAGAVVVEQAALLEQVGQRHAHPRRQPQDGAAGRGEHPRRRPRHHGAARRAARAAGAPAHGVGGARVRGALGVGPATGRGRPASGVSRRRRAQPPAAPGGLALHGEAELVGVAVAQRPRRTDAHAGGLEAGGHAVRAEVALVHDAVGAEARHPVGAGHGAAVAADAEAGVDADDRGVAAALQRGRGAREHARRVLAVHAGERDVAQARLGVLPALDREHRAPRRRAVRGVEVVLVHAGDGTGVAARAAVDVEREGVAGGASRRHLPLAATSAPCRPGSAPTCTRGIPRSGPGRPGPAAGSRRPRDGRGTCAPRRAGRAP